MRPSAVEYSSMCVCRFAEGDVAMMLTLLQSCGLQLRSDDSVSMKVSLLNRLKVKRYSSKL